MQDPGIKIVWILRSSLRSPQDDGGLGKSESARNNHVIASNAKQSSNGVDSSTPHGLPRRSAPRSDGVLCEGELARSHRVIASNAKQSSNGVDSSTSHGLPRRKAPRNEVVAVTVVLSQEELAGFNIVIASPEGAAIQHRFRNEVVATKLSPVFSLNVTPYKKAVLSSPRTSAESTDILPQPVLSRCARTQSHTAR